MNWADFYLLCFAVGFVFSLLSFAMGSMHWHPFHLHVGGHAHVGHGAHGHGAHPGMSPFNPVTLAAFLAWFGGTGYLLTRYSSMWFVIGLGVAVTSGLAGAAIVFLFVSKVLMSKHESLDPADYEMVGVLGRTSTSIRAAGTGEIIYSQAGTRRTCGARAEEGTAIAKGSEVVVTRYEKGIAYVRLWSDLASDEEVQPQNGGGAQ
jgi:membrane protein implicated in regulation of membrane protease activity